MNRKTIIYVDDDGSQRQAMKKLFMVLGYTAEVFSDPKDALHAVRPHIPQLIITDLDMPEMDGVTFCKKLKALNPHAFVYALSGHVRRFGTDHLDVSGFDGYLVKPVDGEKLEKAIEGAFDKLAGVKLGA